MAKVAARLALRPDHIPVRHLYIHVPFCFHKCHYCDFYSLVDTRDRQAGFTDRLCRELRALAGLTRGEPVSSIFVGGGTPTLLRPELWARVLGTLDEAYDLSPMRSGEGEFTVECNPETASAELFDVLVNGGVGRLSMGAQSFRPDHLETLERRHDPESVGRAIGLARGAGIARTSLDLIFAIPGQTRADWREDLDRAVALGPTHMSCYALTYEPNTAMTVRMRRGEFEPADEDLEADMYETTVATLADAGFERYEVSNFARPGEACRHNLAYWRQASWLAAGPSASGHLLDPGGGGWRWKNQPRLDDYLGIDDNGFGRVIDLEEPDPRRLAGERCMTGLRLGEGIDLEAICADLDAQDREAIASVADRAISDGHVEPKGERLRPTDSGFLLADGLASQFLRALA